LAFQKIQQITPRTKNESAIAATMIPSSAAVPPAASTDAG